MPDFKVTWRRCVYALPIPSQHKIVLLALGEYADWDTHDGAHPGTRRLCSDTGCSEKTVQRALAAGVERGLLTQTARGHNTNRSSMANAYDLRLRESTGLYGPIDFGPGRVNRSIRASQPVSTDHLTTPTLTPSSSLTSKDLGFKDPKARAEEGSTSSPELLPRASERSEPECKEPSSSAPKALRASEGDSEDPRVSEPASFPPRPSGTDSATPKGVLAQGFSCHCGSGFRGLDNLSTHVYVRHRDQYDDFIKSLEDVRTLRHFESPNKHSNN